MNNNPAVLDTSGLTLVVERARALLDDGDVEAANLLAVAAYDQAKAAAQFARKFQAGEQLVDKAHRLQGDALLIEACVKMRIADEWDSAQAAGMASLGGRPSKSAKARSFTSAEAGLTTKDIFDARRWSAAEKKSPGIVQRVINDRVASGLEPSRTAVRRQVENRPHGAGGAASEPDHRSFRAQLQIDFDPIDTSYEALLLMLRRTRQMLAFLQAVADHGVPADRAAPLAETYSDDELMAFQAKVVS